VSQSSELQYFYVNFEVCMLQESVLGGSSIMSGLVWFLLAEKGSEGILSRMKGAVECSGDATIYELKKLVRGESTITLGHTDAVKLEVCTHDGDECFADDELSKHPGFGTNKKPFIIYYPPGKAWNRLIPSLLLL
jgi:hypothetical protein